MLDNLHPRKAATCLRIAGLAPVSHSSSTPTDGVITCCDCARPVSKSKQPQFISLRLRKTTESPPAVNGLPFI